MSDESPKDRRVEAEWIMRVNRIGERLGLRPGPSGRVSYVSILNAIDRRAEEAARWRGKIGLPDDALPSEVDSAIVALLDQNRKLNDRIAELMWERAENSGGGEEEEGGGETEERRGWLLCCGSEQVPGIHCCIVPTHPDGPIEFGAQTTYVHECGAGYVWVPIADVDYESVGTMLIRLPDGREVRVDRNRLSFTDGPPSTE